MDDVSNRNAAMSQMLFQANSKSTGVTYLLWFFLGGVGGHRFYAGKPGTAVVFIVLSLIGWTTIWAGVGLLPLAVGIWWLVDAFMIPGWIRNHNTLLAHQVLG